jgi:DNA-binding XRE family transcriptional regulator
MLTQRSLGRFFMMVPGSQTHTFCRTAGVEGLMPQKPYVLDRDECRAARKQLKWTQAELARRALCSVNTIANFEAGRHVTHINVRKAIRQELEDAGMKFSRPVDSRP